MRTTFKRCRFFHSATSFCWRVYGQECWGKIPLWCKKSWSSWDMYSPPESDLNILIPIENWVSIYATKVWKTDKTLDLDRRNKPKYIDWNHWWMSQNIYIEHEKLQEKWPIHHYAQYQSILKHDYHEKGMKESYSYQVCILNNQMMYF